MQIDMHYYGTYAMARAAGLKPEVCRKIATTSQFVDDNAAKLHIEFQDGGRIDSQATAHHVSDVISNLDSEDQRQVWVPFHFLPGNKGESFTERLACVEDSDIAKDMIENHLGYSNQLAGIYLIGIAAHVYADTFSHFGFSGVSSRRNKVDNDSFKFDDNLDPDLKEYISLKAQMFFQHYGKGGGFIANVKSWLAETFSGALGHGAVATYPDRPYLKWSFDYEYPELRSEERDNPKNFLNACESLHDMFYRLGEKNAELSDGTGVNFSEIRTATSSIIKIPANQKDRINLWIDNAPKRQYRPKPF